MKVQIEWREVLDGDEIPEGIDLFVFTTKNNFYVAWVDDYNHGCPVWVNAKDSELELYDDEEITHWAYCKGPGEWKRGELTFHPNSC